MAVFYMNGIKNIISIKFELSAKLFVKQVQDHISQMVYELKIQISKNMGYLDITNNDQIWSQFCTCHDSWAVMTCAKLWPYQSIKRKTIGKVIFTEFNDDILKLVLNGLLNTSLTSSPGRLL